MTRHRASASDSDRRIKQAARFVRVLRLLQCMLGKSRWNAQGLATELECSERTVYRDLAVLELAGVPWFFDDAERCYRVREWFRFPVVNLTRDELLGHAAAAAVAGVPSLGIAPGAKPAMRKLAATSGDAARKIIADAAQLVSVLDLRLADHSRHREIIRTIQCALIERKQLGGRYASPYLGRASNVRLHPVRLCLVRHAWCLLAKPSGEEQVKVYRVSRFKSLRMLDEGADVPDQFDLKQYFGNAWGILREDRSYDVEIRFTKEAAPLVSETTWHDTQRAKHHSDGSVSLMFRVDGLTEIIWWVLGWSGSAQVVRPPELREMVVAQLNTALDLNAPAIARRAK